MKGEKMGLNKHSSGKKLVYLDSTQPVERRVEDLLSKMSLEEKISQLKAKEWPLWKTFSKLFEVEGLSEDKRKKLEGYFLK